jgi:FeS assembly SUF system protein
MTTMTIDRRFLPVIPDHAGEDTPGVPDEFGTPLDIHVDDAQMAEIRPKVVDALKQVFDPEIPVNIYELGLIYDVLVDAERRVGIRMTLTAPACPAAQTLPGEVRDKAKSVEGVTDARVEIVFDPPWTQDRMSDVAKLQLGLW